jgi:hypothetical protein
LGYGLVCGLLVATVVGALAGALDHEQLVGVMVAGSVAAVLQFLGFAARTRWGTTPNRLLAAWAWSTGARFTAVLVMGLAAWRFEGLDVVTSLVGLAGFLFVMLLIEPAFVAPVRLDLNDGETARG